MAKESVICPSCGKGVSVKSLREDVILLTPGSMPPNAHREKVCEGCARGRIALVIRGSATSGVPLEAFARHLRRLALAYEHSHKDGRHLGLEQAAGILERGILPSDEEDLRTAKQIRKEKIKPPNVMAPTGIWEPPSNGAPAKSRRVQIFPTSTNQKPVGDTMAAVAPLFEKPADYSAAHMKLVNALRARDKPTTMYELATLAHYSPSGGSFQKALRELRSWGIVDGDNVHGLFLSPGVSWAGYTPSLLPLAAELLNAWLAKLTATQANILRWCFENTPPERHETYFSRGAIADGTDYEEAGGSFQKAVRELADLGLLHARTRGGPYCVAPILLNPSG